MEKRKILKYLTILQICILLGFGSYAWFADRSNPTISQTNIQVTSAEGLNIRLAIDSANRTTVNLEELFADYGQFELKQVSSADAQTFYTIDFGAGLTYTDPQYVEILPNANGEIDMIEYGFITHQFYLQTEDFGKHVYFHLDTEVTGIASDAIRVALTYEENGVRDTIIFGEEAENGITDPFTTHAVINTGSFTYGTTPPSLVGNQTVYTYSSKNGGRGISDNDPIDLTKTLFTIPANTVMPMFLTIWLEGGDDDCDITLADTSLNMVLKFGSTNELLDPPILTANNQFLTINGLTTAMEYSYTNVAGSAFTQVTNTAMTFNSGTTVYVRYAEVPGVSPMSHVTAITFN